MFFFVASISQRASARVSRNAIIDLTSGNDDDVIPLSSRVSACFVSLLSQKVNVQGLSIFFLW